MSPRPLPTHGRDAGGYSDTYLEHPAREVELLEIAPDTILIATGDGWTEETFAALREVVRTETLVIHLPPGVTLEALDQEQMRAAGWVRANP